MTRPALSVVIPTRDRRATLLATLEALAERASEVGELEVIVVDDGSGDGTAAAVTERATGDPGLRLLSQDPAGPARARNRGIAEARAEFVLLLGDDTVPAAGALKRHLELGAGGDFAVQGRIEWDPASEITRVMRFLAPEGPQFYFKGLEDRRPIPYTAVLGSNLSAPRRWFLDEPFDEGFTDACLEDTELAYRWWRRGRLAVYGRDAVCHHRHVYRTLTPFLHRQVRAGRWARRLVRRHPATLGRVVLQPILFSGVTAAAMLVHALLLRPRREDLWDLRWRLAFARGLVVGARSAELGVRSSELEARSAECGVRSEGGR